MDLICSADIIIVEIYVDIIETQLVYKAFKK